MVKNKQKLMKKVQREMVYVCLDNGLDTNDIINMQKKFGKLPLTKMQIAAYKAWDTIRGN